MRGSGSGCRVQGSGFRVQGSGFRVQGSGFRVQGAGFRRPPPVRVRVAERDPGRVALCLGCVAPFEGPRLGRMLYGLCFQVYGLWVHSVEYDPFTKSQLACRN